MTGVFPSNDIADEVATVLAGVGERGVPCVVVPIGTSLIPRWLGAA